MAEITPEADKLVRELEQRLNLQAVDANRAAFTVLAYRRGWPKAKIARYLGVVRHRVGQRLQKYETYAESGDFPELQRQLEAATEVHKRLKEEKLKQKGSSPAQKATQIVNLNPDAWEDLSTAHQLLKLVS